MIVHGKRELLIKNYRIFIKTTEDISLIDKSLLHTVDDLPVQSMICNIEKINENELNIKGMAYSGNGRNIIFS